MPYAPNGFYFPLETQLHITNQQQLLFTVQDLMSLVKPQKIHVHLDLTKMFITLA